MKKYDYSLKWIVYSIRSGKIYYSSTSRAAAQRYLISNRSALNATCIGVINMIPVSKQSL